MVLERSVVSKVLGNEFKRKMSRELDKDMWIS